MPSDSLSALLLRALPFCPPELQTEIAAALLPSQASTVRGTRLPRDWKPDSVLWGWAKRERPDLNVMQQVECFCDYWTGVPGARGVKLDWSATFRNWVRNQKTGVVGQKGKVLQGIESLQAMKTDEFRLEAMP